MAAAVPCQALCACDPHLYRTDSVCEDGPRWYNARTVLGHPHPPRLLVSSVRLSVSVVGTLRLLRLLYRWPRIPVTSVKSHCNSGVRKKTHFNLGQESAIRGNAVAAILNEMKCIFPR